MHKEPLYSITENRASKASTNKLPNNLELFEVKFSVTPTTIPMAKPRKKATATAKTKTLKAPVKKQRPTEPAPKPRKKRAKQTAGDETDVVDDRPDIEPKLVSGGDGDDMKSSDEEVRN